MANDDAGDTKGSAGDISYPAWGAAIQVDLNADAAAGYLAPPGVKLAYEGVLDRALYVYVAQISEADKLVTQLYPPANGSVVVPAATPVRLPAEGSWLVTTARGHVRVVASTRALSVAEIAKELGGREPPPGSVTVKGA